jgi:hypothetical protein
MKTTTLKQDPSDPCVLRCSDGNGEFWFTSIPDEKPRKKDVDRAAELARRWNAFEPDGEVAQLRAENERLKELMNAGVAEFSMLVPFLRPPYKDGVIAWRDAARAALGKVTS